MNHKPIRILVADDERTLSFFLQKSLESDDPSYCVETSHSGAEALVKVVRTPFDLVIADLRMPGLNGLQLVKHARDLNSSTQAILMTAYGSDGAEAVAKEMGVEYIAKPFAMEDMKRLVRKAIRAQGKEREKDDNEPCRDQTGHDRDPLPDRRGVMCLRPLDHHG